MQAAATCYRSPYGDFQLQRYPRRRVEPLQAWCQADTLLLQRALELDVEPFSTLVVNDDHGALAVALLPALSWTDSKLAELALKANLAGNQRPPVLVCWSTTTPTGDFDAALIRVPKSLPMFEFQLATLASLLPTGATVLAAGMDKHLPPHTASLLERYLGPTRRHRGQRKARLFESRRSSEPPPAPVPAVSYYCEPLQAQLQSLPNVFSNDHLDHGSRFLIEQLPSLAAVSRAIDLACGNGVLGLALLQQRRARELLFCDESAMAIASARRNLEQLLPHCLAHCEFKLGDGLRGYQGAKAQLVLCNPPFHLQHTVDDYAGRRLLEQAARCLEPSGRLCLVANRHLDYAPTLRRHFVQVERLAQNSKFIVWLGAKPTAA